MLTHPSLRVYSDTNKLAAGAAYASVNGPWDKALVLSDDHKEEDSSSTATNAVAQQPAAENLVAAQNDAQENQVHEDQEAQEENTDQEELQPRPTLENQVHEDQEAQEENPDEEELIFNEDFRPRYASRVESSMEAGSVFVTDNKGDLYVADGADPSRVMTVLTSRVSRRAR